MYDVYYVERTKEVIDMFVLARRNISVLFFSRLTLDHMMYAVYVYHPYFPRESWVLILVRRKLNLFDLTRYESCAQKEME